MNKLFLLLFIPSCTHKARPMQYFNAPGWQLKVDASPGRLPRVYPVYVDTLKGEWSSMEQNYRPYKLIN